MDREITDLFNEKFGTNKTKDQVRHHCQFLGFKNGQSGKFDRNNILWQKAFLKKNLKSIIQRKACKY